MRMIWDESLFVTHNPIAKIISFRSRASSGEHTIPPRKEEKSHTIIPSLTHTSRNINEGGLSSSNFNGIGRVQYKLVFHDLIWRRAFFPLRKVKKVQEEKKIFMVFIHCNLQSYKLPLPRTLLSLLFICHLVVALEIFRDHPGHLTLHPVPNSGD